MVELLYKQGKNNDGTEAVKDIFAVMKAAVTRGDGNVHFRTDCTTPEVGPKGALIKVEYSAICGTDDEAVKGNMQKDLRIPNDGDQYRTLGHEFSGRVVALGPETKNQALLGQEAIVTAVYGYCGKCQADLKGQFNLCRDYVFPGIHVNGGLARYFAIEDAKDLVPLPEGVSTLEAFPAGDALLTSRHALNLINATPDDYLAIWGVGGLGLATEINADAIGIPPEQRWLIDIREEMLEEIQGVTGANIVNSGGKPVGRDIMKASGYRLNKVIDAFGSGGRLSNVYKKLRTHFVSFDPNGLVEAANKFNESKNTVTLVEKVKEAMEFMNKKKFQGIVRKELTKGTVMDAYSALIKGGALCVIGARFGEEIILPVLNFMGTEKLLTGPWGGPYTTAVQVLDDIASKRIKPEYLALLRGKEFEFTEEGVKAAFASLGKVRGRVFFNMKD